ncbi:BZ3500_MvSof-1268-A1-R1_Chr3-1g05723 [Microbotryum saponariae]|uniref:DNA polymerase n=1 Tax=Microbotryum saponariae TaxID=289078 RepID=A0A2X0LZG8_9BASI|nr:BZ3500_MvSof-1268-A1-R1_Chr3-1g05723 [Microbotryum saponariae]SDA04913.1 BZ3501_MvSof-1269-A2-R1_Chr3-1g05393 [Microbotryum saponariae]
MSPSKNKNKNKFDTKVATRCEHNFAQESKKPARTMSAPSCAVKGEVAYSPLMLEGPEDPLRREPVVSTSNKAKQNATPESAPRVARTAPKVAVDSSEETARRGCPGGSIYRYRTVTTQLDRALRNDDDHPAGSTAITPVNILACFRESPRLCVNQCLVDKLKLLREERFLLYGSAHPKAISYATAISVIIGTPWKIRTAEQARSLPKVGEKIVTKIEEYLRTGEIDDAVRVGNNSKVLALKDMSAVHGVGHVMANSLYTKGLRSLQEMRDSKQWEKEFQWHDDIQQKMPRHEVESIHEFIKIQIEKVEPGATTLLCGGYRRGKELSNDVDILITYAENDGKERGVLARLVERLRVKGFIPPDGVLSLHTRK